MLCYTLPPNGNSVPLPRLLSREGRGYPARDFRDAMASRFGVPPASFLPASSGSSALYAALLGLSALEPRRRAVAVPAWCCPSVPQAVLQAGLDPVPVDLDPSTLGYDASALRKARDRDLLAVILVHFFGLPQPIPQGDWQGTAFLRDCAQDFDHRPADGVPSVYSFGRGKALNAGHGGALCVPGGGPLLAACVRALASLPEAAADPRPMALAINLLSNPRLYWAVSRLPGLGLGRTAWHRLEPARVSPRFESVGLASLEAYASCRGFYRRLIQGYREVVAACDGDWVATPAAPGDDRLPARFPLLVREPRLRETLANELGARFGGVTLMYPSVLGDLPGAPEGFPGGAGFPGGRRIAREILTLPVTAEMAKVEGPFLDCLKGILERAGAMRRGPARSAAANPAPKPAPAPAPSAVPVPAPSAVPVPVPVATPAPALAGTQAMHAESDWNPAAGSDPKGEEVLALGKSGEP